jgi:hypothetical protein
MEILTVNTSQDQEQEIINMVKNVLDMISLSWPKVSAKLLTVSKASIGLTGLNNYLSALVRDLTRWESLDRGIIDSQEYLDILKILRVLVSSQSWFLSIHYFRLS